jgi:hypothetical protein
MSDPKQDMTNEHVEPNAAPEQQADDVLADTPSDAAVTPEPLAAGDPAAEKPVATKKVIFRAGDHPFRSSSDRFDPWCIGIHRRHLIPGQF